MRRLTIVGLVISALMAVSEPAWSDADAEQGKALYLAGDYEPAAQIFERILDGRGDDEVALFYMGKIRFDHSDLDGAKKYLERLVEMKPDNAEYQLALGNVYGQKARTSGFFMNKKKWAGRWKERLEMAFELDPQNLDAREWLAVYLLNAPGIGGGDKGRGTTIARETIEIDAVFGRVLLGYAYRRSGEVDLAIAEYKTVLEMDAENGRAYSGLGFCYLAEEEFDKAEASFTRAIEVTPDDSDAYESMAYYWSKRGEKEAEAESQEGALRTNPLLSDVRYELARNYEERDLTTEAIFHYEQLIALTPKHYQSKKAKSRLKKLKNPKRTH